MSLGYGGRADKSGNVYEDHFFAKLLLDLLLERLISIEVEPLGSEGNGIEFVAVAPDGERRYYQCKGSNGAQSYWRPSDLDKYTVFQDAKAHILSGENHTYYFISPVPYDELDTLCNRVRSCDGTEEAFAEQLSNASLKKWKEHCERKFQAKGKELIYLLSRCHFELEPTGEESRRQLESIISILFVEDGSCSSEAIRTLLERFANDQSYWGKPIHAYEVSDWLKSRGIHQRKLSQDVRGLPRIQEINLTFAERFLPIISPLIHRFETDEVMKYIQRGQSVIIQGSAGSGKSGCMQEIVRALEDGNTPYLALSLDKDQPEHSPDQYGKLLGLSDSPVASLYRVAGGQRCVLIFDQLDALRWTNSRTSTMLDVCKAMLRQVRHFNQWENGNIVCIFAVRTFDLETDPGLRMLLDTSNREETRGISWEKVTVGLLSEKQVQEIAGKEFLQLSTRLKKLLRTPLNLYIWSQIKGEDRNTITTLFDLMDKWWQQILLDCECMGVSREAVIQCHKQLTMEMKDKETLFVPLLPSENQRAVDALVSCGVLIKDGRKLGFCHQNFWDYTLVMDSLGRLQQGVPIAEIVGGEDRQTPDVRYQLLMLLQYLLEADHAWFIEVCRALLDGPNIRYYFQCAAFEVLGQLGQPDRKDWELLCGYYENPKWRPFLIQTVFRGHPAFIRMLSDQMPGYPWHEAEGRDLLFSIVKQDSQLVWEIFQKVGLDIFLPNELYEIVRECSDETSELYTVRIGLLMYDIYAVQDKFAIYNLVESMSVWAIPVIEKWITSLPQQRERMFFPPKEKLELYARQNGEQIVEKLLPITLETAKKEFTNPYRNKWSASHLRESTEREIIALVQFALCQMAIEKPEYFFEQISKLEEVDSPVKQELYLHAMEELPLACADKFLCWLLSDFEQHIFEKTGVENSSLACCQRLIERFSPYCSEWLFTQLEQTIVRWKPSVEKMCARYKERMAYRKEAGGWNYTGAFWGELQRVLLPALAPERIAPSTKDLIRVLRRRFPELPSQFNIYHMEMAKFISSPIDGHLDKLSDMSWLELINTMSKCPEEKRRRDWDSAIETSPFTISRSLSAAAKMQPERFAALSLRFPQDVEETFIDAVVSELGSPQIPLPLVCTVLRRFCGTPSAQMANTFSRVLCERAGEEWPDDILQELSEIARCHEDPKADSSPFCKDKEEAELSCNDLLQHSINCARGNALTTIAEILWKRPELANKFEETLKQASEDKNPTVLFAAMRCTIPWYNIDQTFSKTIFNQLLKRELRTLGAPQAWDLLMRFYELDSDFYIERLYSACRSNINDLKKCAFEMFAVLTIMGWFEMEKLLAMAMDEEQVDAICRQAVYCFQEEEYNAQCKALLLNLVEKHAKLSQLRILFFDKRIEIPRDRDFLIALLEKGSNSEIAGEVLQYLSEIDINVKDYAEIIYSICRKGSDLLQGSLRFHMGDLAGCVAHIFCVGKEEPGVLTTCLDIWDEIYRMNPLMIQPLKDLLEES